MPETPETPGKPGKPELPKLDFTPLEEAFKGVGIAIAKIGKELAVLTAGLRAGPLAACSRDTCGHPRFQHAAGACAGKNWHCTCIGFREPVPAPPDSL